MSILSAIVTTVRQAYSLLPAGLTAVFAVGLAFLSRINQPLNSNIIDTHVNILGLQSTRLQFLVYGLCAATIVAATIVILLINHFAGPAAAPKQAFRIEKLCDLTIVPILVLLFICTSGSYKLPFFVALAIGLPLATFLLSDSKRRKWFKLSVIAASLTYLSAAYLIPLVYQYPLAGVDALVSHETHHAVTVLPGVDVARGQRFENPGGYYYGFIMPMSVLITSWLTGLSPSDPLITVRAVQLFNILASILVVCLAYLHLPRGWKWLSLLSLPLLPSLSLAHSSISHPNQAGIRYITLLVALLVLTAIDRQHQRDKAWILGATGGLLMAINLELGVCINAGFITYTIVNCLHQKSGLIKQAILYAGPGLIAFMAMSWTALAGLTSTSDLSSLGYFVSMFGGSGYGGMVSVPSFLAVAVFFASTMIITKEALLISSEQRLDNEKNNAFSCGIAMMILAWLPYYVNRMSEWNLWILPFLLFLITINYTEERLGKMAPQSLYFRLSASLLLPLTLATTFVGGVEGAASALGYVRRLKANDCRIINWSESDYCVSGDIADRTQKLNTYLANQQEAKGQFLILSPFHDSHGRIAGFNMQFPWHAAIGSITLDEVKAQSKWIDSKGPAFLLVPIPEESDSVSTKERIRHLRLIADGASNYFETDAKDGWSVYQRK
jgi:hypothetical protein